MSMRFQEIFLTEPYFIFEAPLAIRIKRETDIKLDKDLCLFNLLYDQPGVNALTKFYHQDIRTAERYNIPIILNCPTLRAAQDTIRQMGYKTPEGMTKINQDAVDFTRAIRDQYPDFSEGIFLSGMIGPKVNANEPLTTQSIEQAQDYHTPQAQALAHAKVELLFVDMMTNINETIGAAHAAATADVTYGVGIMVTQEGTLLDGTPIETLIEAIDNTVSPRPFFYIISCTYPTMIAQALSRQAPNYQRILGIKANAWPYPQVPLAQRNKAKADSPEKFAKLTVNVGKTFNFKIYGGCCTADNRHLSALCAQLTFPP